MRQIKFLVFAIALGLSFNSCSDELDVVETEQNTTHELERNNNYLYDNWNNNSKTKGGLSQLGFCDYVQITSQTNGHQMRSRVNLNWTVSFNFPPPPPPPGLVRYTVEFQPGTIVGENLTYGTPYFFEEEEISTVTNISVSYDSLNQLDGNVQGRWRVRVEDCAWTDWKDYYFDL